jgi:hypothetical protein
MMDRRDWERLVRDESPECCEYDETLDTVVHRYPQGNKGRCYCGGSITRRPRKPVRPGTFGKRGKGSKEE